MQLAGIAAHTASLMHGIGAALLCAAIFHLAGLSILPGLTVRSSIPREAPALVGVAAYVLVCWFGVGLFGVPVRVLVPGFSAATVAVAVARMRATRLALDRSLGVTTLRWTGAFALFYGLLYLFTMPSVAGDTLPPAWLGNIDLLTYARYTKYVLWLRPTNLAYPDASYFDVIYFHTPAVFYLQGAVASLFGFDPLTAAMPVAFGFAAWLATCAARMARAVFGVPRAAALLIGATLLAGPFFRYVFGEYFLSTLMSAPVFLFVIWLTVAHLPAGRFDVAAALSFLGAYIVLLFVYPVMLALTLAVQCGVLCALLVAEGTSGSGDRDAWRAARRAARSRGLTAGAALLTLVVALFARVSWAASHLRVLSQPNGNGWSMDAISPLAIAGWPATWVRPELCAWCVSMEMGRGRAAWVSAFAFAAAAATVALPYFWRLRSESGAAARTLVGLAVGAHAAYGAYFLRTGESYQQWKLASYLTMPWTFALFAAAVGLGERLSSVTRSSWLPPPRLVARVTLAVLSVLLVAGNGLAHLRADPEMTRLPAALGQLATINANAGFREVTVMMDEGTDGLSSWLALYLLGEKRVHVVSRRNSPSEPLSLDTISRQRPLLVEHFGCEGIGHDETEEVPGVGCLLYAPPSLQLGVPYGFGQTYWFITPTGLGPREPDGRWDAHSAVKFDLLADIQRTPLFQDAFVNLHLTPYLPPGTTHQRVRFTWGAGRVAEADLQASGTLSLPVRRTDWQGTRMWTLTLSTTLPDRLTPVPLYAPRGHADDAALAVRFERLSVTAAPEGPVPDANYRTR